MTTPEARLTAPENTRIIQDAAYTACNIGRVLGSPAPVTVEALKAENAELKAQLAAPRGTDAQILKEQALTAEMISGCIGLGFTGGEYPPDDHAWMRLFYRVGAENAEFLAALQAAIECGLIPSSSAREGGACAHSRQAQVADQVRDAVAKATGSAS